MKYIISEDKTHYYLLNIDAKYTSTCCPKYQKEWLRLIARELENRGNEIEGLELLE